MCFSFTLLFSHALIAYDDRIHHCNDHIIFPIHSACILG